MTQPIAVIQHPNHPSVTVTARKLDRAEKWEIEEELSSDRRPISISDADGQPMFNPATKQPYYAWDERSERSSLKSAMARPRKSVTSWSGITDGKRVGEGRPVPYSPDTLRILWADEKYDVTRDVCFGCEQAKDHSDHTPNDANDKAHRFIGTIPFGAYVNRQIAEERIFDADPSETGSV